MLVSIPAMNHNGTICVPLAGGRLLDEAENRQRVFRHSVVWPVGVVILENVALAQLLLIGLDFDVTNFECSECVGCQNFLLSQSHFYKAIRLRSSPWPV